MRLPLFVGTLGFTTYLLAVSTGCCRSKDGPGVVSTSPPEPVQVFLAAEGQECAIYPVSPPHLAQTDSTVPHAIYWTSLGHHSFNISNFVITGTAVPWWPFNGSAHPITPSAGGTSGPLFTDSSKAPNDVSYTVTIDGAATVCNSVLPDRSAMGIHITK